MRDLDTRTPEQKAEDDTTEKARQRERYLNYQHEYSRKNAEKKREYARAYREQKKAEEAIAEATEKSAGETKSATPKPAA